MKTVMGQRDEKRLPNIEALYIHIPFCRKSVLL